MLTILFLTRALDIGGAQRQLVELAAGLHQMGWKVQVLTFYGGGALERRLHEAGVEVVGLEKRGRWDVFGFLWRMMRTIRRARPDIVHGYLDVPNILLAVFRPLFSGARIVWGVRASNVDLTRYDLLSRIVFRLGVMTSRWADLVICNSESGRAYHAARGYHGSRMMVLPNGIDLQQFRPDARAREEVRVEWGIEAHEKLIGVVGRLDPMKDHRNFLMAAARVAAVRREARFVCIGDGPASYRASLMSVAKDLGLDKRLMWTAARTDIWRVYNALDLAVSSSAFGEGTSNAIAEAMATGLPCVVTDVGDSSALVADFGWVCPPGDSSALGDAIIEVLSGLPRNPQPIRRHIARHFSVDVLLRRTAEALRALIEQDIAPVDAAHHRPKCQR